MRRKSPRRRHALGALAASASLLALLFSAAPAGALKITWATLDSSTNSAGAYSDFDLDLRFCDPYSLNCNPAEKASPLTDLSITLPAGMVPSGERELCSEQAFMQMLTPTDCPEDSRIGTILVHVVSFSGTPSAADGSVFAIAAGDSQPARIGIFIDPLVNSNYELTHLVAPVTVQNGDRATFTVKDLPTAVHYDDGTVFWPYYKVTEVELFLFGSWKAYLRNPTACTADKFQIAVESSDGSSDQRDFDFTTTDCDVLPFNPTLSMTAGESGQTAGNSSPPVDLSVAVPTDDAAVASAKIKLPAALRPSSAALAAHSCQPDDYRAGNCPAGSRIGSLTVHTPLLPDPLTGPLLLVKAPGEMRVGVIAQLEGAVSIELTGSAGFEGSQSVVTFDNLPDVPVSDFSVALKGGNDGVFTATSDLCGSALTADSSFTGKNGAVTTVQTPVSISGCGPAAASIDGGRVLVGGGYAPITVRCSNRGSSCSGSLALTGSRTSRSSRARTRRARRPLAAGDASFQIAAGRSKVVPVKLTKAVAKTLKVKRKLAVAATAKVGTSNAVARLTLQAAARPEKKRANKRR